jgi:hypothetical protein
MQIAVVSRSRSLVGPHHVVSIYFVACDLPLCCVRGAHANHFYRRAANLRSKTSTSMHTRAVVMVATMAVRTLVLECETCSLVCGGIGILTHPVIVLDVLLVNFEERSCPAHYVPHFGRFLSVFNACLQLMQRLLCRATTTGKKIRNPQTRYAWKT